jgi:hypothetical protein
MCRRDLDAAGLAAGALGGDRRDLLRDRAGGSLLEPELLGWRRGHDRLGGKHLVVVQYAPNHPTVYEVVFNDADIDGSDIVFARDMGEEENPKLLNYFGQRRAWLMEADALAIRPIVR